MSLYFGSRPAKLHGQANAFRHEAFYANRYSSVAVIEGTVFELDDAKRVIETGIPMPNREEASHDILGTYKLISNREEMKVTPETPDELLNKILYRVFPPLDYVHLHTNFAC